MVTGLEDVHVDRLTPGVSVVRFTGEHDFATSSPTSELFDSLLDSSELVVADLSRATFIDSSMLRVLIQVHKAALERDKDFRVYLGSEALVRRTFQISGLLEHTPWISSSDGDGRGSPVEGSDGKAV